MIRTRLLLLPVLLAVVAGTARGAEPKHHVLLAFDMDPVLLTAPGADLRVQLVIMNLDGFVAFQETARLAPSGDPAGGIVTYKKPVMLARGEYLAQALFFDPGRDAFAVLAASIELDKKSARDLTIRLNLTGLPESGFGEQRRMLEFNPDRMGRLFFDHMLWYRVRYSSVRDPEAWGGVFARIKVLAVQLNFSPFARNWQEQTATAPPGFLIPYVVSDRIFDMTVRADNLVFLADEMARSTSPGGPDPRRVFSAMEDEAGAFRASYRRLNMKSIYGGDWDRSRFDTELRGLGEPECRARLAEWIRWLWTAVEQNFYTANRRIDAGRLALEDPGVLVEKIRLAAAWLAELTSKSPPRG